MRPNTPSIEDVMNFLVEHRGPNLPAGGLAGVFETLTWCLDVEASEAHSPDKAPMAGVG